MTRFQQWFAVKIKNQNFKFIHDLVKNNSGYAEYVWFIFKLFTFGHL